VSSLFAKLKAFAFWVCFLIVVVAISNLKDKSQDADVKQKIDIALHDFDNELRLFSPKGQSLFVLPTGERWTDEYIQQLLKPLYDKSGSVTFTYNHTETVAMSAQGVNRSHFLVNAFLEGYQPFTVENVMMPLYVLAQRKNYMLDSLQYSGREEVWQSSREAFLFPRGDCEDHALALADWLIAMNEDARVVLGDMDGNGHAWVVLFKNGKEYLLEATRKNRLERNKPYPLAMLYPDYHPTFMFNRKGFWMNNGSKYTTDYSGKHWQKTSEYSNEAMSDLSSNNSFVSDES
tara:strand:+ start:6432 stop:7301 length:870 start_codon:yes stop_codon:yes gene_type:complete